MLDGKTVCLGLLLCSFFFFFFFFFCQILFSIFFFFCLAFCVSCVGYYVQLKKKSGTKFAIRHWCDTMTPTDNQSIKRIIKAYFTFMSRDTVRNSQNVKDVLIFGITPGFIDFRRENSSTVSSTFSRDRKSIAFISTFRHSMANAVENTSE